MAEPVSGADLFGQSTAPDKALAPASPAPVSGDHLFGTKDTTPVNGEDFFATSPADQGAALAPKMVKDLKMEKLSMKIDPESPVANAMTVFRLPQRLMMGAAFNPHILDAAVMLGVPGAKEFKDKVNPTSSMIPDTTPSDATDFLMDQANRVTGMTDIGPMARKAFEGTKFGLGAAANIAIDPLWALGMGTATPLAAEVAKMGELKLLAPDQLSQVSSHLKSLGTSLDEYKAAQGQKNLVSVGLGGEQWGSVPMSHPAVQSALSTLKSIPGVEGTAEWLRKFSPNTGIGPIDQGMSTYSGMSAGAPQLIRQQYVSPWALRNYGREEQALAYATLEATPNLTPAISAKTLKAARPGLFGGDEAAIRAAVEKSLPKLIEKVGISLAPGRAEQLADDVVTLRKMMAQSVEHMHAAGLVDHTNINEKLIPNYAPRMMDPAFKGIKSLEELNAKAFIGGMADESQKAAQIMGRSGLYAMSPIKARVLRGMSHAEAQEYVSATKGFPDYFLNDPMQAAATRLAESLKYRRDSQLLDVISEHGMRMGPSEAKAAGWEAIQAPKFDKKLVLIKDGEGKMIRAPQNQVFFPPDIARKINHLVAPAAVGNVGAAWKWFTAVFRHNIFLQPAMWIRNIADNITKTFVMKTELSSYREATAHLLGHGEAFRSAPSALYPQGRLWTPEMYKNASMTFGLDKGNFFHDGANEVLNAGKKTTMAQIMSTPGGVGKVGLSARYAREMVGPILHSVEKFGEGGENITRNALFLQRLKEGWEPAAAFKHVEDVLFNYGRNSPTTDKLRYFMPFIQHPIKSLAAAPMLLGHGPGVYNLVHNTFPKILANAFHDPVTQDAINKILPESLRSKDAIAGPLLGANTWLAHIFGAPGGKPMAYLTPSLGMSILNHFAVWKQESAVGGYGLHPFFSAVMKAVHLGPGATDEFGQPIDETPHKIDWQARGGYIFSHGILGTLLPFPNSGKMIDQAFGIGNAKFFEPAAVLALRGVLGTLGGITDLTRDYTLKTFSLGLLRKDIVTSMHKAVAKETGRMKQATPLAKYVKATYGEIVGTTPVKLYKEWTDANAQAKGAMTAMQEIGGVLSAGDYASRIHAIDEETARLNYNFIGTTNRYLEMAKGSKTPAEARARAGVKLSE